MGEGDEEGWEGGFLRGAGTAEDGWVGGAEGVRSKERKRLL